MQHDPLQTAAGEASETMEEEREAPTLSSQQILEIALRGVSACRRGSWEVGMADLATAAAAERGRKELPSVFYSYLGYGIARFENRRREGVALCKHAIKMEFYEGENYLNLARLFVWIDNKPGAVRVLRKGLAVDSQNRAMRKMIRELGLRREPVLRFLDRAHPLNIFLGKIRHRLTSPR